MQIPQGLNALLAAHVEALLLALLIVSAILALACIALTLRVGRLTRLYSRLTRGTSGGNLEEILLGYMAAVGDAARRVEALERQTADLVATQRRCVQKVAVVRFDAFDDVGGKQSFALALLDGSGTGITLSSVFSRTDVRVYAKGIDGGAAQIPLSDEERRAVAVASER